MSKNSTLAEKNSRVQNSMKPTHFRKETFIKRGIRNQFEKEKDGSIYYLVTCAFPHMCPIWFRA